MYFKTQIDQIIELDHSDDRAEIDEALYKIHSNQNGRNYVRNSKASTIEHQFDETMNAQFDFSNLSVIQLDGDIETMHTILTQHYSTAQTVWISHAETIVSVSQKDAIFWTIRQSMQYSVRLRHIGDMFRRDYLEPDNQEGGLWANSYLAIHYRQGNLLPSKSSGAPDLDCTLKQIKALVTSLLDTPLERLYLATDLDGRDYQAFRDRIMLQVKVKVFNFNDYEKRDDLEDGELIVLDQWIAANARWFVGTSESSFTARIMETRRILGLADNSTLNVLCKNCDHRLVLKMCKPRPASF